MRVRHGRILQFAVLRWSTIPRVPSYPSRLAIWTALAITAALLLSRLWFVTHRALDLDEFEHAHAAWSVSRGLLPYLDFFEHHPPGLYLLSAPIFADPDVATRVPAAVRALTLARATMWLITVLSVVVVYRIGVTIHGALSGALAAMLLATSSQFLESMLEFRPDGPAVASLIVSIWCAVGVGDAEESLRGDVRLFAAGCAFGAALLFTQKAIFAAPGLGLAFVARRRALPVALFAAGVTVPIAITMWWFARHDALRLLWYYTVILNGRLNADRFSPLPRLVSHVVQQPAIYVLGAIGIAVRLKPGTTAKATTIPVVSGFSRTVVVFTALSLIAGIFIIGKAHDQYYALLLPLLAIAGGAVAADRCLRAPRRGVIAPALMIGCAALSLAISARAFTPIGPQLADLAFVIEHTTPTDAYVGGSPGPALFRPHGWFYFFLTGDFATAAEYTDLLRSLRSGDRRPRLIVRDRYLAQHAPPALLAYIDAHFDRARGDLYMRQSEYGSASLNSSEASDRFDRPLTR
jgi:4-amino-4-deoxy-L-arabinose transferase-like glycosyltransferase